MRRKNINLLIIFALIAMSFAVWGARNAAAQNGGQSKILYHGGPVMQGHSNVYFIWYGNWSSNLPGSNAETQTILREFALGLGVSPYLKINTTYHDSLGNTPSGVLFYGGDVDDPYSHGKELTVADIEEIVSDRLLTEDLPVDASGIYIVLGSSDIGSGATNFCDPNRPNAPPHHESFRYVGTDIKYAFIGNAARCPTLSAPQFFAPDGRQLPTPNGNLAADAMASMMAYALDTIITNPVGNGWFDSNGKENAEKCRGTFGQTYPTFSDALANMKLGSRDFLIQQNWVNHEAGYCGLRVDTPPETDDTYVFTDEDKAVTLTLWADDIDGDLLTFKLVTQPQHGTFIELRTAKTASWRYTPNPNFNGTDGFTFKVSDGMLESRLAFVNITVKPVNDAPVAVGDGYSTAENTPLNIAKASGVLMNDTDAEGTALSAILMGSPSHASDFKLNNDGSFSYTPAANFNGTDVFTYKTNDGSADSNTALVIIEVNDGGTLQFNAATFDVNENAGNASIMISRTGGSAGTATVMLSTGSGTAGAADYTSVSQTVTFADGETSKTINVPITDDALNEAAETVNLTLSKAGGSGQPGTAQTAVLTINDNDAQPSLTVDDVSVTEGTTGTTVNAVFTVKLSAASGLSVSVAYATASGTAQASADYVATAGTLAFSPGETQKTVTVSVRGDNANEANETFFLTLSHPQNATVSDGQGTGTILDDDAPGVEFGSNAFSFAEGAGHGDIIVRRTGDTSQPLTVDYQSNDQSALTPCQTNTTGLASDRCDYGTAAGMLQFAAGEAQKTIQLVLVNDAYVEPSEQLSITLSNPQGASLGSLATATVTITDNDSQLAVTNPVDELDFFIRQLYIDFLGREPEAEGFAFWKNRMTGQCPTGQQCDRTDTAFRFFQSDEFRERGYFVYLFYNAALGRRPTYSEWILDVSKLNGPKTVPEQEAARSAFINEFMNRQEFMNLYNGSQTGQTFVDALIQRSGVTPASRQALIDHYRTADRGATLRAFLETPEVQAAFLDRAFITMLYFGFLRRDAEPGGFQFWMQKLESTNHDNRFLIGGFLQSDEYRFRFAQLSQTPSGQ